VGSIKGKPTHPSRLLVTAQSAACHQRQTAGSAAELEVPVNSRAVEHAFRASPSRGPTLAPIGACSDAEVEIEAGMRVAANVAPTPARLDHARSHGLTASTRVTRSTFRRTTQPRRRRGTVGSRLSYRRLRMCERAAHARCFTEPGCATVEALAVFQLPVHGPPRQIGGSDPALAAAGSSSSPAAATIAASPFRAMPRGV
jgi:hypothetical protein